MTLKVIFSLFCGKISVISVQPKVEETLEDPTQQPDKWRTASKSRGGMEGRRCKKNACGLQSALAMTLKVILSLFVAKCRSIAKSKVGKTFEDPTNGAPVQRAVEWKDVDTRKTRAGFSHDTLVDFQPLFFRNVGQQANCLNFFRYVNAHIL